MNNVPNGFSLTNRWLLYTSLLLTPASAVAGLGSNCPSSVGFLAYNWYTQYQWYAAIERRELHALSLLPVHFNLIYSLTYLGGVTSGNPVLAVFLGFGTAGLIILNTLSAWTSWVRDLPEGYGKNQFFFFGWRVLTPGWRTFILLWQIGDTILAFNAVFIAIYLAFLSTSLDEDDCPPWWARFAAIAAAPLVMAFVWPLILWTELIIHRNHITSETDMIAVWLFIAQIVATMVPTCSPSRLAPHRDLRLSTLLRSWRSRNSNAGGPSSSLPLGNIGTV